MPENPIAGLYPQPPGDPPNPLTMVQGYATLAHQMGENKLQQMQIRGRQALGQIITKNTDNNGNLDLPRFKNDIAQNPDAAQFFLQEQQAAHAANPLTSYMGKNAAGQPTPAQAPQDLIPGLYPQTGGQQPQEDNVPKSQEEIDAGHDHLDAMDEAVGNLAKDPNINHKKVIGTVTDLVANPKAHFSPMDAASILSQVPYGPNGEPAGHEELQAKIQPLHQQIQQNKAAYAERYPSSNQIKARQGASPVDLAAGSPGVATGMPAGYSTGVEHLAAAGADNINAMAKDIQGSGDRVAPLRQVKEALDHTTGTGPKTEAVNSMKSYLLTFAPEFAEKVGSIDPASVNAYDEMSKLLVRYAASQPGASGSDMRALNAIEGNPNMHMQPGAIKTIINSLIGREIKLQVMGKAWAEAQRQGAQPADFNEFANSWQNLDQRAFNMEDRTPEEAHELIQDVKKTGQAKNFAQSLKIARAYGKSLKSKSEK